LLRLFPWCVPEMGATNQPALSQAPEQVYCFVLAGGVLRKQGPGGTPAQDCPGIVVHPGFNLGHLRRRDFIKVCPFGKKPADDAVHVLIGASLGCAVRVAVIYLCAGLSPSEGLLHPGAILKFAPVVNGDALEYLLKIFTQLPLQPVQHLDYAGHRVVRNPENKAIPGEPLRQNYKGGFTALAAHYAVHLPMAERFPVLDLWWPVLYSFPFGLPGPFGRLRLFLVVLALIE